MQIADILFCTKEDLPAIYLIERESFGSDAWSYSVFADDLLSATPNCIYLKAILKAELAGYLVAEHASARIHIMNICVKSTFRRRKIASQLMLGVEEIGKYLRCKQMTLEVRESNQGAIELYSQSGYARQKSLYNYYGDGENAFVFTKEINPEG